MNSSLELVDFTQSLPAQGWKRLPQAQHVGRAFASPGPQDEQVSADARKPTKGDAHFALGNKVRMKPRKPQGPDRLV